MNTESTNIEDPIETSTEKRPVAHPIQKIIDSLKPGEPISMKSAFWSVVGLHLLAVLGIVAFSTNSSAQAKQVEEDKKFVLANAPMVGVETPPSALPIPSPHEKPAAAAPPAVAKPKVVRMIPKNPNPDYPHLTKDYVVKKGDTFTAIVKRYGLDRARLKSINGIKDENKLRIGQKLKFIE
jgi:LysM repeat protein